MRASPPVLRGFASCFQNLPRGSRHPEVRDKGRRAMTQTLEDTQPAEDQRLCPCCQPSGPSLSLAPTRPVPVCVPEHGDSRSPWLSPAVPRSVLHEAWCETWPPRRRVWGLLEQLHCWGRGMLLPPPRLLPQSTRGLGWRAGVHLLAWLPAPAPSTQRLSRGRLRFITDAQGGGFLPRPLPLASAESKVDALPATGSSRTCTAHGFPSVRGAG